MSVDKNGHLSSYYIRVDAFMSYINFEVHDEDDNISFVVVSITQQQMTMNRNNSIIMTSFV